METGTLKELNLKPGDVVECVECNPFHPFDFFKMKQYTITENIYGARLCNGISERFWDASTQKFRLISRASDTPKTWGEMTDAEKGALLLAAHEGKVIEWDHHNNFSTWEPCDEDCLWDDEFYYRVRPEPVRETVTLHGRKYITTVHPDGIWDFDRNEERGDDTHRITLTLTDGTPDCTKCQTCGTAKHVDMEAL